MKKKRKNNNSYKYLKHFDSIFDTNTRKTIKQMPLFRVFYEYFVDDFYIADEETKKLIEKRTQLSIRLDRTFTEEQRKLHEKYWDTESEIQEIMRQQLFLYGYTVATELFIETTQKKMNKNTFRTPKIDKI